MALRRFVLGLVVGLSCLLPAARAILVDVGGTPVGGYFVRDDGQKLVIRVRTADGQDRMNEYDRAKTKITIVHQLDRKALESLSRDNPQAYRTYAEVLARQEGDPEARDTAMRLFLIAAYLDPRQFGHSCLLGMSRLAGTPAERRRCLAMAFLLDPKGDGSALKADAAKPAQPGKAQVGALQDFLKALQDYRTGQIASARTLAARDGVDGIFSMAPGTLDRRAFLQLCTDATCPTCGGKKKAKCVLCSGAGVIRNNFGGFQRCELCKGKKIVPCTACQGTGVNLVIADGTLRSLLRDELWALDQLSGAGVGGKKGAGEAKWSAILRARQVSPVSPLSLETVTEFNPRECLYRNGHWVAP
jgi:hypothetical protein